MGPPVDKERWPSQRWADRRLRSRACATADVVMIGLGGLLFVVPIVAATWTWPSDAVVISPTRLEWLAGAVLLPGWSWLMVSGAVVYGLRLRRGTMSGWSRPPRSLGVVLVAMGCVALATIIIGLFLGAAKGSVRVDDGRHLVTSGSLPGDGWTAVSPGEYRTWEARFLRLDATLALFGLMMVAAGFDLLTKRKKLLAQAATA